MGPQCAAALCLLLSFAGATASAASGCPADAGEDASSLLQTVGALPERMHLEASSAQSISEAAGILGLHQVQTLFKEEAEFGRFDALAVVAELIVFASLVIALVWFCLNNTAALAGDGACDKQQESCEEDEQKADSDGSIRDGSGGNSASLVTTPSVVVEQTRPRVLQAASLLYICLNAVDNAIVVPGSYDLAASLNMSVGFSGAIYGTFQLGWAAGVLLARRDAQSWNQASIRARIIATFLAIGCVDLAYGCLLRSGVVEGQKLGLMLLTLRFCAGCGIGYASLLHWMALHVTKASDQTSFALIYAVAVNAGMICAPPILAAAMTLSDSSIRGQFAAPLYPVALLWMTFALFLIVVIPRHLDRDAALEEAGQSDLSSEVPEASLPVESRRALLQLGWAMALTRGCMVAGIELGTPMMLETQFGWPVRSVGLGLMVVGLCTIVVCCTGAAAKAAGHGPGARAIVAASVVSAFSLMPLFDIRGAGPAAILTADALVYSTTFFTQGVCDGIANNAAIKGEAGYSLEDYQVGKVLSISLGRAWASVCARWALDSFGRNAYAGGQLTLGLLGCATACRVASLVRSSPQLK